MLRRRRHIRPEILGQQEDLHRRVPVLCFAQAVSEICYSRSVLRYHVAFYLPRGENRMVVAEALDFPGALSQGFDLADARRMIAAAIQELASVLLEQGQPLPQPRTDVEAPDADLIELIPLTVEVGTARP